MNWAVDVHDVSCALYITDNFLSKIPSLSAIFELWLEPGDVTSGDRAPRQPMASLSLPSNRPARPPNRALLSSSSSSSSSAAAAGNDACKRTQGSPNGLWARARPFARLPRGRDPSLTPKSVSRSRSAPIDRRVRRRAAANGLGLKKREKEEEGSLSLSLPLSASCFLWPCLLLQCVRTSVRRANRNDDLPPKIIVLLSKRLKEVLSKTLFGHHCFRGGQSGQV
jgi:hypothetical protein